MDEFHRLDASALASLIRRRLASSREITEAAIAQVERFNPQINAVVTPLFQQARRAADRADDITSSGAKLPGLHGVPILVKDLFDFQAGVRNTFGSKVFADFAPPETSAPRPPTPPDSQTATL